MKKLIVSVGITALAAVTSFAQGTVVFGNTTGTKISTNSIVGGAATGATSAFAQGGVNFYYALFYSTTQTAVSGNTAALAGNTGVYALNAAGWNNGSVTYFSTNTGVGRLQTSTPNSDGSAGVSNLSGGTTANFVIIGWSSNIGSDLTALQSYLANPNVAGWVGESAVSGSLTPGTLGSTSASALFGTGTGFIPGFTLGLVTPSVTPEPGTMVLAGLGGLALLGLRRKK